MSPSKPRSTDEANDFADFAALATDNRLSKYEKIGFPDSYRAGFEQSIFRDVVRKLPILETENAKVIDIGPGCSDLPMMLIDLCRTQQHQLHVIDSREMLAHLPDEAFITKHPGFFPNCQDALAHLTANVDAILCYSVLQYVMVDSNVLAFMDAALSLLAPGGEMLIGDIPNVSKRHRFFSSDAGIAFHQNFTGTDTLPPQASDTNGKIDDLIIFDLLLHARKAGAEAYVVPQDPALPMANRREDILVRKP